MLNQASTPRALHELEREFASHADEIGEVVQPAIRELEWELTHNGLR